MSKLTVLREAAQEAFVVTTAGPLLGLFSSLVTSLLSSSQAASLALAQPGAAVAAALASSVAVGPTYILRSPYPVEMHDPSKGC